MLAKISAKSAKNYYYEKDAFFNKDENGEINLIIKGETSKELGIFNNEAEKEKFIDLLDGKLGEQELRYKDQVQSGKERAGYDFVFSAPKSVSHAALVLDQKDVIEAHKQAVDVAMKELEKYAGARVKNSVGEREFEKTGNLLYASATHSTSRPAGDNKPDPSLHTHNVIFNTTKTSKGDYRALSNEEMMRKQNLVMSTYKQQLAYNLKQKGYDLVFDKKGHFEIKGYEESTLKNFSKRSEEIKVKAEEMKTDDRYSHISDSRAKNFAQHEFKKDKKEYTKDELKNDWDRQHKQANIQDKDELIKIIQEQKNTKNERINSSQFKSVDEVIELASTNLISKKAHVSMSELKRELIKANNGDFDINEVFKKVENIPTEGQINGHDLKRIIVDGEERITNKKIYDATERVSQMLLDASSRKSEALVSVDQANENLKDFEKMKGWKLSETQREAVFNLLTTTDSISSTIGDAGTGKTAMLEALNYVYTKVNGEDQAFNDLGVLAPTGKAASGAKADSGIKSATADSFILNDGFKDEKPNELLNNKLKEFGFKDSPVIHEKKWSIHKDQALGINKTGKLETIKVGKFKGATKTTITNKKGDSFNTNITIEFKGSKTITDIKTNKIIPYIADSKDFRFFNSDDKSLKQDKESRFMGFKSTVKREAYYHEGKFLDLKVETSITFLGKEIRSTTYNADKDNVVQTVSKWGKEPIVSVSEQKGKLKDIDAKLDKQEASLNNTKPKLIVIDETSMLDIEKTEKLIAYAMEHNIKLSFIGDNKQLLSVGAGRAFDDILKFSNSNRMNEANRQKTAETKDVVDTFARGEAIEAMKKLDKYGKIEVGSTESNINKITDNLSSKNEKGEFNYKNTIALASTRKEIEAINSQTREKLFGSADAGKKVKVMIGTGLDEIGRSKIENYEKGQLVLVKTADDKTTLYKINEINKDKTLSLESVKMGKDPVTKTVIDPRKEWKKISASYDVKELGFEVGDKVMNFQNNKKLNIMNGDIGIVKKVNDKSLVIDFGKDKEAVVMKIDPERPLNLGHAYGMTIHKSQGVTEDKALVLMNSDSNMINKNLAYVAVSRSKYDLTVYTDNKEALYDKVDKKQEQASTSDSNEQKISLHKDYVESTKGNGVEQKFKDIIQKDYDDLKKQSSDLYKTYKDVIKDIDKIETSIKSSLVDSKENKDDKAVNYYNDKLEHLHKIKDDVEKRMNSKVDVNDALESKKEKLADITKQEEKIVNSLNEKIKHSKNEIKTYEDKNDKLINDLEKLKDKNVDKHSTTEEKEKYKEIKDEIKSNSSKIEAYKKESENIKDNTKLSAKSKENLTKDINERVNKLEDKNEALANDKDKIEEKALSKMDKKETEQLKDIVDNIEKNGNRIEILKDVLKDEIVKDNQKLNDLEKTKEPLEKEIANDFNTNKKDINSSKKDFNDLRKDMKVGFKDEMIEDPSNKVSETIKEEIKRLSTSEVYREAKGDLKDNSIPDDKRMVANIDENISKRDGFSPSALESWKEYATDKAQDDDAKKVIETFVDVSHERVQQLKDIAILNEDGSFKDGRAKEIFENNKGGSLEDMAVLSRDSYKEAISNEIDKLTEKSKEYLENGRITDHDKIEQKIEKLEKTLNPPVDVVEKEKEFSQAYKDVKLRDDKFEVKSNEKTNEEKTEKSSNNKSEDLKDSNLQSVDKTDKVEIKEEVKTGNSKEDKLNSLIDRKDNLKTELEDTKEKFVNKHSSPDDKEKYQEIKNDIKDNLTKIDLYKKESENINNSTRLSDKSKDNLNKDITERVNKLESKVDNLKKESEKIEEKTFDKLDKNEKQQLNEVVSNIEINDKNINKLKNDIKADEAKADLKEYKNDFKDELKTDNQKVDLKEYKDDFKDELKANDKTSDNKQEVKSNDKNVEVEKASDNKTEDNKKDFKSNDKSEDGKSQSVDKADNKDEVKSNDKTDNKAEDKLDKTSNDKSENTTDKETTKNNSITDDEEQKRAMTRR